MSYEDWFVAHLQKHRKIIEKLSKQNCTKEQIIEYFDFDNMVENEPDFCPLYKEQHKCHEMEKLNCYLCACPHFRYNDKGLYTVHDKIQYSFCSIHAKDSQLFYSQNSIHQDCSSCTLPHKESYIAKNFDLDLAQIMKRCKNADSREEKI